MYFERIILGNDELGFEAKLNMIRPLTQFPVIYIKCEVY